MHLFLYPSKLKFFSRAGVYSKFNWSYNYPRQDKFIWILQVLNEFLHACFPISCVLGDFGIEEKKEEGGKLLQQIDAFQFYHTVISSRNGETAQCLQQSSSVLLCLLGMWQVEQLMDIFLQHQLPFLEEDFWPTTTSPINWSAT